jgi:tetratricopeptide (TPR) repeat protein
MSSYYRYELRNKLGAGGMGAVYIARDRLSGNIVALKRVLIPDEKVQDNSTSDLLTAIATEFRTLAGLRHPHVIGVMDYGFIHDGSSPQPYFTMDYLPDARSLTNAAANQPVEIQVRLLTEMLLALAYLHRRGIIHRDLKPDNVLVDGSGAVKLLDFGLALSVTGQSRGSFTEGVAGTMAYMAPELFAEETATVQSDLYAVGLLMYEVFTGSYPFNRKNMMLLLNDIMNTTPDIGSLEFDLGNLIERLLAKDPAQRPGDADTVIRELCEATGQPLPSEGQAVRESFLRASQFVGRTTEMERLKTALDAILNPADGQQAQVYLIGGESGVGKSRLLDELRTRALVKGAVVLRGQSVTEGGLPFQLWRDIARELSLSTPLNDLEAGILKEIVPDIGILLHRDIAAAPELTASAAQQRLVLTLINLLKHQRSPVMLLLEDLHWAGESLVALQQIQDAREQLPRLLVVGTYRDDERPNLPDALPGTQRLKLHRLNEAEIGELAHSMLGETGIQSDVLSLLKRETEGNAFFMVETIRALAEEAGTLSNIGRITLPRQVVAGGVQQIIRRRLSRVPDFLHSVLNRAAVAGRLLDLNILQKLTDIDLNQFLNAGASAGVLEIVEERWRFAHDKLREMLLTDLHDEQRRDLHRAVATVIEASYLDNESYYETLMEHWRVAGDTAKELHYLLPVVTHLINISADYVRAVQLTERGLALAGEQSDATSPLLYQMGRIHYRQNDYPTALQWAKQAHEAAERMNNLKDAATSLRLHSLVAYSQGQMAAGMDYTQQSLAIFQEIGFKPGIADMLCDLGTASVYQGNYAAASDYFQQSLALSREIGHLNGIANALSNLGDVAYKNRDMAAASDYFQQSLSMSRENGDRASVSIDLTNLGFVAQQQQDFATARDYYQQSLAICREIGDQSGIANALGNLGNLAELQQDFAAAGDYYQQCLAIARQIGEPWVVAITLNNLGFVTMSQGDKATAVLHFAGALCIAYEIPFPLVILESIIGFALVRVGTPDTLYAAELAGLVEQHPGTETGTQSAEWSRLRRELETALPADELAAAMERGKALDFEATVQKLLVENSDGGNL